MFETALIELHYFPTIQYFTKFLLYPTIVIEQCENYRKGSYRNRMHIASANGLLRLSVPLIKGKNQQQSIREVQIAYAEPWQNKQWMAIQSAYGNSPYFEYYEHSIRPFFQQKPTHLFEFNKAILNQLLSLLSIAPTIEFSPNYVKKTSRNVLDLRNTIHPKNKFVIDAHFKQDTYEQVFQEKTGFLPNLSILDLIFCKGPEAILILEASILGEAGTEGRT